MEHLAESIAANIREAMRDERKGLQDLPARDLEALCDPEIAHLVSARVNFSHGFASQLSDIAKFIKLRQDVLNFQRNAADDFAGFVVRVDTPPLPDDTDSTFEE